MCPSTAAAAAHQPLFPPCCKLTAPCLSACSDVAWDYKGSCGKCKEVKCKSTGLKDGYGAWLDRHVCYNDYASVVVMVTDTVRVLLLTVDRPMNVQLLLCDTCSRCTSACRSKQLRQWPGSPSMFCPQG